MLSLKVCMYFFPAFPREKLFISRKLQAPFAILMVAPYNIINYSLILSSLHFSFYQDFVTRIIKTVLSLLQTVQGGLVV